MERNKAAQIARAIDDERNSGVEIVVLEGDEPNADFHAMLEGTAADVVSKEEAEAAEVESCEFEKVMFKVRCFCPKKPKKNLCPASSLTLPL